MRFFKKRLQKVAYKALSVVLLCSFVFLPFKLALAESFYTCWNCHEFNSRDESENCSQCGWDMCETCGACSPDCVSSRVTKANPAEATFYCWNCRVINSTGDSTSCSKCGWYKCVACGVCSPDCVNSKVYARISKFVDYKHLVSYVFPAGVLLFIGLIFIKSKKKKRSSSKDVK